MRHALSFGRRERERVAARTRAVLESPASVEWRDRRSAPPAPSAGGWVPDPLNGRAAVVPPNPLPADPPELPAEPVPGRRRAPGRATRGFRLDPGRRGAAALGVTAAVAVVLTVVWVLGARPHALALTEPARPGLPAAPTRSTAAPTGPRSSIGTATAGSPRPVATGTPVVVDVAGRVRRPGVYTLPMTARVYDAVRAAGGALPGVSLASVNLAARLVDGEQVTIGVAAAPASSTPGGASGAPAADHGPVDLNTATAEQLQTLPGVGPVLAQHILDWRAQHGGFTSIVQLHSVPGIGDAKFAALRDLVSV